jgi:restriction endonuclease Mrr
MAKKDFEHLLRHGEAIQYCTQQPIWCRIESSVGQSTAKYNLCITNSRLLWHKSGFLRDYVISEPKTRVCSANYSETGVIFKKGLITIELPDARLWFKGSLITIRAIYDQIRSILELRESPQREKGQIQRRIKRESRQKARMEEKAMWQEKEQALKDKIHSEPNNPLPYFELGLLYEEAINGPRRLAKHLKETKITKAAKDCYAKALALGLSEPIQKGIAHTALAQRGFFAGYINASDLVATNLYYLQEAAKEFNIALKINPEDADTARRLADIYSMLDKKKEEGRMLALAEEIETRKNLHVAPKLAPTSEVIDKTGISFEEKCIKLLEERGFTCQRTAITGDGGIDIVATSSQPLLKGTYIVRCKHWKNPVGEPLLRDLFEVVASENANKGILITNSTFTEAAQNFARSKNIELIDGDQLEQLVRQHHLKRRPAKK